MKWQISDDLLVEHLSDIPNLENGVCREIAVYIIVMRDCRIDDSV